MSIPPLYELEDISVHAVRLAEDPEFVQQIVQLRATAFGEGGPWNYGLDRQDQQAVQMVAFDASGPVGALRLCLGDELLAQSGLQGFYMNTGWEFEPQAEEFFDTAIEYGRLWVVRGHPRTQGIINALLASIGAFSRAHPRYQSVFGTVALLDYPPESCRLIADFLRHHHFSGVRRVRPRRPLEVDAGTPPLPASPAPSRTKAFRALVHQLRTIDADHPVPALLHLYLRQGAEMLGDVTLDATGRKLLIPLYDSVTTFQSFAERLRLRSGTPSGREPAPTSAPGFID